MVYPKVHCAPSPFVGFPTHEITKSTGIIRLPTCTIKSSITPFVYIIDLSANYKNMVVGFSSPTPSYKYNE